MDTHGPGVRYLGIAGMSEEDFKALDCPTLAKNETGVFIDARLPANLIFRI